MHEDPARGKWIVILESCGMDPSHLTGKQCPCPKCGGKDRFRFDNKDDRGTWFCNVCGAGDGYHLFMHFRKVDFKQAKQMIATEFGGMRPAKKKTLDHTPTLNRLWNTATSDLTKIYEYLHARGITDMPAEFIQRHIRFHPECPWSNGAVRGKAPAMLARIFQDGKPVTIHRTFLDPQVPQRKMIMPHNGKLNGCYIPLGPQPAGILGVAEGIETALSAMQMHNFAFPVWATTSAMQMERFNPPEGIKGLVVFGDNDQSYTGQAAAYALAKKATVKIHIDASVHIPDRADQDWNDVLNLRKQA